VGARHGDELQVVGFNFLSLADTAVDNLFQARGIKIKVMKQVTGLDEYR